MTQQGVKAIGSQNLYAIEIGNEPNLGGFSSPKDYVQQWLNYSAAISANVLGLPSGPIYQGLTLASGPSAPFSMWVQTAPCFDAFELLTTISETLFADGVDRRNNLKTVSHHL